ncbi:N-6 DNA methylase, partial [Klebsiella pneumoniae]
MADSACVAFILPELIVCSAAFTKFRSRLLKFCSVVAVAEIGSGAFKGTEAKTYIVILQKGESDKSFTFIDTSGASVAKQ